MAQRGCDNRRVRKLRQPRPMNEATETMRAHAPHRRAAIEARERATSLLREVEDPKAGLTPEQRAERRGQIAGLQKDARREEETVRGLTAKLETRLPAWIKITK